MKYIFAIMLFSCVVIADDAVITAKTKTTAEAVYEKAVADNTKEAERAYQAYVKALDDANAKVLKALESAKADLNDTKKFTKLTITERATAIAEIEEKIKAVKAGAVGEIIVDSGKKEISRNKIISVRPLVGKWNFALQGSNTGFINIDINGNVAHSHGVKGKLQIINDSAEIAWNNNTKWIISKRDESFYATDDVAESKLTK